MPVLEAESETVSLDRGLPTDMALDELSVAAIREGAARLDTGHAVAGGSSDQFAWMEPAPGVQPRSRSRVQLSVEGAWGGSRITAPTEVYDLPEGQLLRAVFYTLTLAIGRDGIHEVLRWWLEPGGDDATLRADALDFLSGLHRGGILSMIGAMDGRKIATVRLEPKEFDPELAEAHPFLTNVATLEEWSGVRLPVPEEVGVQEATDIARAVAIVMARQLPLTVAEELSVVLRNEVAASEFDELRLPRNFTETLLRTPVPLGSCLLAVGVVPIAREPAGEGLLRVRCRLANDQPRRVQAHLYPPPTRSRVLRRTLVAGSPLPPRPDDLLRQLDAVRLDQLGELLEQWEEHEGPVDAELLERVRKQWPA